MWKALKATIYNLLGMFCLRRRDIVGAIAHFSNALDCVPDFPAALINRSFAYHIVDDHHSAVLDCTRAIEINPGIAMAFFNRGISEKALEGYDQAIVDHSQAVALDPGFADAFGELGVAYSCRHRHAEAIVILDKAIALKPKEAGFYKERGYARFQLGEFDAAASDLRRSLGMQADPFAALLCYLARARTGDAATEELAQHAKALKRDEWPFPVVAMFLGSVPPDALLSGASSPAEQGEAHYYLGQWHLLRNDTERAGEAFRQASRMAPTNYTEYVGAIAELRRLQQ